jgi:hypothetical protein
MVQHSIIIKLFDKIFNLTKKYYKFSIAGKTINGISSAIKNIFIHSFIYKKFSNGNRSFSEKLENSIMGKIERILHKIVAMLHLVYKKGITGSGVLKIEDIIKNSPQKTKIQFISFAIIGVISAYNLMGFINKSIYVLQLYVSGIILFITINVYFMDINKVYQNSFLKKIVDSLIKM